MAKDKQPKGQMSMPLDGKKSKRGFFGFLKRKGSVVKDKSTSEKTVFSANGKEYEVETSHGRCKRFQAELKSGKNSVTGKPLSETDKAYRKGVVNTMGEQARIFKKKNGQ